MTPADATARVAECVLDAVRRSVADGDLSVTVPREVRLVRPRIRERGDYATGVALELAGAARRPPLEVAELVAGRLRTQTGIGSVEVAGAGFLNIRVAAGATNAVVRDVLTQGTEYGRGDAFAGQRFVLPFARTDGPDTVRWAVVGRALERILRAVGATVTAVDRPVDPPTGQRDGSGGGPTAQPGPGFPEGPGIPSVLEGETLGPLPAGLVRLAGRPAPTLAAVTAAVGVDAARYMIARAPLHTDVDVDVEWWRRRTWDNPLFAVQYAHARAASLLRNAYDLGITLGDPLAGPPAGPSTDPSAGPPTVDFGLLGHERELELLRVLGEFPQVLLRTARQRAVHRLTRYLEEVADAYHRCGETCPALPKGDEPVTPLIVSRLWLCEATRTVLSNGLGLLGVRTPDRL